jgi:glucose/mannose-6-phosphate isomerase
VTSTTARSPLPVDSLGMWDAAAGLPEQVATAIDAAEAADLGSIGSHAAFCDVVVCGMGGSGIAADVAAAACARRGSVPVSVVKSYTMPAHVGPGTLVLAVSCSGDTEETIAAAADARVRGAAVVTVAGPGDLASQAAREGSPLVPVPTGIPQPRAAFGALSVPPLVVLERLGLLGGAREALRRAVLVLSTSRDALVAPGNVAEELARRIGTTIPLVHGASGPTAVAAMRWKTQVNENAKAPAFFSVQPELSHNEVAGWARRGEVTREAITVVMLRYPGEHPRVGRRFDLVKNLVDRDVANVIEVRTDAEEDLAALFDLALLGDFVSLYLAGDNGVDPGPVPVLGELKAHLASWSS